MSKHLYRISNDLWMIALAIFCFQTISCGKSSEELENEALLKEQEAFRKSLDVKYTGKVKPFSLYQEHDFSEEGYGLILILAGGCAGLSVNQTHSGYFVSDSKVLHQVKESWVLEEKTGPHFCGYHSHATLLKNGEWLQANAMDVSRNDGSHLLIDGIGYLFSPEKLKVVVDAGKPINEVEKLFDSVEEGRAFLARKRQEDSFVFGGKPFWENIDGHLQFERKFDCKHLHGRTVYKLDETRKMLQKALGRKNVWVIYKGGMISPKRANAPPCEIKYEVQLNRSEVKRLQGWKITEIWSKFDHIPWTYYEYANRKNDFPHIF